MKELKDYTNLASKDTVYVVFDTETTGFSKMNDSILEIGAIKFSLKDGILETFSQLIDPQIPIPKRVSKIHGIYDKDVKGQPLIEEVLPNFLKFIQGTILIAHNIQFDLGFIRCNIDKLKLNDISNDFIDSLKMAKNLLPGRTNYKLQEIATSLGIVALEAHRALDDSRVCMEIFKAMANKK